MTTPGKPADVWLLPAAVKRVPAEAVVVTSVGGERGGGASLTAAGRELIENFHAVSRAAVAGAGAALDVPGRALSGAVHATL